MSKGTRDTLFLQGMILACAGILTKIIGFIYRIPMANTITSLMKELMGVIIPREGEESKIGRNIRSFFSRFISINTRNIVKKYILNQNKILEKQYYGGLNPIWYYCVDSIEDYKKCKTQCSSVNYALANQYIELMRRTFPIFFR